MHHLFLPRLSRALYTSIPHLKPPANRLGPPKISPPLTSKEIDELIYSSSWSTESIRPKPDAKTEDITPEQLRHLLHLSALPPPSSKEEEDKMLRDLKEQLAFVRAVQEVDTEGVEGLAMIRDETLGELKVEDLVEEGRTRSRGVDVEGERLEEVYKLEKVKGRGMGEEPVEGRGGKRMGRFVTVRGRKGEEDDE